MERGSSISYRKEVQTSQKRTYVPSTYLEKNPMTMEKVLKEEKILKGDWWI